MSEYQRGPIGGTFTFNMGGRTSNPMLYNVDSETQHREFVSVCGWAEVDRLDGEADDLARAARLWRNKLRLRSRPLREMAAYRREMAALKARALEEQL